MTPHPDWHARFEALLTQKPPTPHEAGETPADGPRGLGGRAGWTAFVVLACVVVAGFAYLAAFVICRGT